jgi:hypothetical protein
MTLPHPPLVGIVGAAVIGLLSLSAPYWFSSKRASSAATARIIAKPPAARESSAAAIDEHGIAAFSAEDALRFKLELLERGRQFLNTVPGYTAEFTRQEEVQGELLESQTMLLKCRHRPFSVYLLWITGDVGQEVLYVEGTNNGKLLAHDGGWKARLPAFSLAPTSSLAMRDSRYPVTVAGLLGLIETMTATHATDLDESRCLSCVVEPNAEFAGRPCWAFTTHYKNPHSSPVYRKSMTWIDREWSVPVATQHFGWPSSDSNALPGDLDEQTLVELYQYTDLDFGRQLGDADFDRTNSEYHFRGLH